MALMMTSIQNVTGNISYAPNSLPCKQWFLQAGRYATKGEKPLRASVCFFDRVAVQRYGRIN